MFNRLFSKSGLSLERLRTFCEVADAGSMAKAANADVVRQSQFSRQIKELEEHFGLKLTERVGRNVSLTADGWELAAMARQILSGLDGFHGRTGGGGDLIVLGAGESVLRGLVVARLQDIRTRLPNVVLEMRNLRGPETVESLEEGRIDLGVLDEDMARIGMETIRLGRVSYRLVTWCGRGADGEGEIDPREFLRRPFVVLGGGDNWENKAKELASKVGTEANIAVRCASWHAVADAVRAVHGTGFLPSIVDVPQDCFAVPMPTLKLPEKGLLLAWSARRGDLRADSSRWRRVLSEVLKVDNEGGAKGK
jgi:DNA-binding transcriptional LysR family regulator